MLQLLRRSSIPARLLHAHVACSTASACLDVSLAVVCLQVQRWLESAFFGKSMSYSPDGMLWGQEWGTLRIAALYAHIAFKAAEILDKRADDNGEVVNVRSALLRCDCAVSKPFVCKQHVGVQ